MLKERLGQEVYTTYIKDMAGWRDNWHFNVYELIDLLSFQTSIELFKFLSSRSLLSYKPFSYK